ncbi:MAG: hypothetical protein LIQ30_08375 [Planctomycetes bacterium]|nr:hypothetical protein [Planctomycetota bacterium]MCC8116776.1 hypothetical protein [Planctomycetota bacterium]MCD7896453.1 hypothetical protein [Planctomycetaceae bacterium]
MSKPLRFFIAGIIQGSLPDACHPQDYRREIAALLRNAFPGAEVFDPVEEYPDSIQYDDAKASAAFFDLMDRAGKADVLIAFVPEASMGTAIELWNAHHAGSYVVTVSGLTKNWVARYLSDVMLPDLPALEEYIRSGALATGIRGKLGDGPLTV